jgi:hypothetical protein
MGESPSHDALPSQERPEGYSPYGPLQLAEGGTFDLSQVDSVNKLLTAVGLLDQWVSKLPARWGEFFHASSYEEFGRFQIETVYVDHVLDAMRSVYLAEHFLRIPTSAIDAYGLSMLAKEANRLIPKPIEDELNTANNFWFTHIEEGNIVFRYGQSAIASPEDAPEAQPISLHDVYELAKYDLDKRTLEFALDIGIDLNSQSRNTVGMVVQGRPEVRVLLKRFSTIQHDIRAKVGLYTFGFSILDETGEDAKEITDMFGIIGVESVKVVGDCRNLLESPREPERVPLTTAYTAMHKMFSKLTAEGYHISIDTEAQVVNDDGTPVEDKKIPLDDISVSFSEDLWPSVAENVRTNIGKTYMARDVTQPHREGHLRALRVHWSLETSGQRLRMIIEDDGIGFHPDIIAAGGFRQGLMAWKTEETGVKGTGFALAGLSDQASDYDATLIPLNRIHQEQRRDAETGEEQLVDVIDGGTLIFDFKRV